MDHIIAGYKVIRSDDDLVYCTHLAYQKDMSRSVSYDQAYYENYVGREGTPIAKKLNLVRTRLTQRYVAKGALVDIGIGSGEFIKSSRLKCYGYDINPWGVRWLRERGLYVDPYQEVPADVVGWTLWDTLEHIPEPQKLFERIPSHHYVFVSLPTFDNVLEVKSSKHYKPNEHYYYFSVSGLIKFMADSGFEHLEYNDHETQAGREGVSSFAFQRS